MEVFTLHVGSIPLTMRVTLGLPLRSVGTVPGGVSFSHWLEIEDRRQQWTGLQGKTRQADGSDEIRYLYESHAKLAPLFR